MPPVTPFIPERITVHLGPPDSNARNVTVSFVDYVKNVASSEIYPTWEESALRANILANGAAKIWPVRGIIPPRSSEAITGMWKL